MASIKQTATGTFQVCFQNKLLPKRLWMTFDTFEQADAYTKQLEVLLAQGIVPTSLLERSKAKQELWTVHRCIVEYQRNNPVPVSDQKLLDTVMPSVATLVSGELNYAWAEGWIAKMKRVDNLAPSTIHHRHGALARCFDWMTRARPEIMAQNPLRLLKRGFATYTPEDGRLLAKLGKHAKIDEERDRRLEQGEEQRILAVMDGRDIELCFFVLALETAMRMRECYTLDKSQVVLPQKTIQLSRTKNGDSRQVPLTKPALAILTDYMKRHATDIKDRDGRLFPYWNGDLSVWALDEVSADVSRLFKNIFVEAEVTGLKFHDLRHEATCRLYEKTNLSDVLIAKITGHKDLRMLKRYASLRGSELALRLW
jgi:integrase